MPQQRLLLEPEAREAFKRGFDTMANVLRVTLGPKARTVALESMSQRTAAPEIMNDGATIARRIVELPDRFENMGAMLIRHLAWHVGEQAGDGTTTTAVIAQSILDQAYKAMAAGFNPMALRRGIERGARVMLEEITALTTTLETRDEIKRLASVVCLDEYMGALIGEIVETLGRDAIIMVEESRSMNRVDREYVEGMQWDKGYLSPYFITNPDRMDCTIESPFVLVTDRQLKRADEVIPALEAVKSVGGKSLVVFANTVEAEALATLVVNKQEGEIQTLAIKAPGAGNRMVHILEDIAIMTGGTFVSDDSGDTTEDITAADLGRARRIWSNRDFFTIVGGMGSEVAIRRRIQEVKKLLPDEKNEFERNKMRERIGKLSGGIAILKVGGFTEGEMKEKKLRADDAMLAVRAALEEGVVPGGGIAFIHAAKVLRKLKASDEEEAYGIRIMAEAAEAPLRQILLNGGYEPEAIIADIYRKRYPTGFDAQDGKFVNMITAGIVDPIKVVRSALTKGVSGGIMAMTTESLISPGKYDMNVNP